MTLLRFVIVLVLAASSGARCDDDPDAVEIGRRIYMQGVLPGDVPLIGQVQGDVIVSGAQAACVNCHRRSGYGSDEGNNIVPPVVGRLLFAPRPAQGPRLGMDRPPYTDATLTRALREGTHASGRPLRAPMPHFQMRPEDTTALIAYLKALAATNVPGLNNDELHLATIVADNVPATQRDALLGVLEKYFQDQNNDVAFRRRANPSHRTNSRFWRLHVWHLRGSPDTWGAQIVAHYQREPVFAVLGGLGRGDWGEVHSVCEQLTLPCLFPLIEYAPRQANDFYSFYFSEGLAREADLLAQRLRELAQRSALRVAQVYRRDDSGAFAAASVRASVRDDARIQWSEITLESNATAWNEIMARHYDVVVVWLRDADMVNLTTVSVSDDTSYYFSDTLLASPATAIPAALHARTQMLSTTHSPGYWRTQRARVIDWLRMHQLDVIDERTQADTTLMLALFTLAYSHIGGRELTREHLIERLEHTNDAELTWPSRFAALNMGSGKRVASFAGEINQLPK